MVTKKTMRVFFLLLVISVLVLGFSIQAMAETMNFKLYTWVAEKLAVPVGDVEGHIVLLNWRKAFYAFENGEIATVNVAGSSDLIKGAGPISLYVTINFADGSIMVIKSQGTYRPAAGTYAAATEWKGEIIKGTGRFEGAKGTLTAKAKLFPLEKGDAGPRGYGDGTITYTLPPK